MLLNYLRNILQVHLILNMLHFIENDLKPTFLSKIFQKLPIAPAQVRGATTYENVLRAFREIINSF